MTNIAVFGQMGGSSGFPRGGYHLVERGAVRKVGIQLAAEFARTAGARVEAFQYLSINVFHEALLLGRCEYSPRWSVRQRLGPECDCYPVNRETSFYYRAGICTSPLQMPYWAWQKQPWD